jgi:Ca2+-transporting ATPase
MAGGDELGLSEVEAAARRAEVGPNELPQPRGRDVAAIVAETLREPMFLLMGGAAVLYLALGDVGEGLFLVAAAAMSIGLVIAQEARSERALAALRELAQPQVRVVRAGGERRIPARELVPGDILLVGEGERLAADGLLVAGDVLSVDESALTGESAPVAKRPAAGDEVFGPDAEPDPLTRPHLFSGTLVVRGQGVVRVARTGADTALGRIGRSLASAAPEPTPLQKASGRLVGVLGAAALGFCVVIAAVYGLLRHNWAEGALYGITVAISLVPEEFPMVLAVFLALGAWRLASHRVLVRRSAAIEALGASTVLCVDKTGTLTENRMRVARLWTDTGEVAVDAGSPASGGAARLLQIAALASAVRPVDPMDRAVREVAPAPAADLRPAAAEPERSWPLKPARLAVVQLWRSADGGALAAAKGAPEAVFDLCRVPPQARERLMSVVAGFAAAGLRVLAAAVCRTRGDFPDEPGDAAFVFAGLIGFLDPVRPDVPQALAEARAAGVSVVMITGDHPATALAVAGAAGLETASGVLLGAEAAKLPFPSLREQLRSVRVFARVAPEQKLLIVEALKANGEVVAMTGDGINDAPALEAAHIGLAMGRKGTDVAREAADLILLDDSFTSIIGGVRLGRRIFENLRKALVYVVAIHVPIAGLALAPLLFGLPPVLYPMHVALLELAIDPICALAFEGEPSDAAAMRRPPRPPEESLFGARQLKLALAQGGGLLAAVLGIYVWGLAVAPDAEARGAAFLALVVGNLVLALTDSMAPGAKLFARHRLAYGAIAAVALAGVGAALAAPYAEAMFRMATPEPRLLIGALAAAVVGGGWARAFGLPAHPGAARPAAVRAAAASGPPRRRP